MLAPDLCAAIAAACPDLPAPDAAFAAFVEERGLDAELTGERAIDLAVAYHAARGHAAAVDRLRRALEELRAPLRRTGADATQIDELLADLPGDLIAPRAAAPARIHGYSGRGPFGAWLRVIAVRTLVDRRRQAGAAPDDGDVADLAAPTLDPELDLLRRQHAGEFRAAFAAAVGALDPADRALLRQHHLDGVSLDALARMHGVHRATVARRLATARAAIAATARRRLVEQLRIGAPTFDSIVRLVQNELDWTLERYL